MFRRRLICALVAIGAAPVGVDAQQRNAQAAGQPPSVAQPADVEPQSTTASFGDWTLRCSASGSASQKKRVCEVVQTLTMQGQNAPFAQIAFGALASGAPIQMTAVLPVNIAIAAPARVALNDKGEQALDLSWTRCLPQGCYATGAPSADSLKRWRTAAENGRLTFRAGNDQTIAAPLSFKGLGAALDALAREK